MPGYALGLFALNLPTFLWGTTFVVVKGAVGEMAPSLLVFLRFLLASLFFLPWAGRLPRGVWGPGMELAFWLLLGYASQAIGLMYTTASRSAFITALNVVLVPLILGLAGRSLGGVWVAALLAFLGVGFLSYDPRQPPLNAGDFWTLLTALTYALYIVRLEVHAKAFPSLPLTAVQVFGTTLFGPPLGPLGGGGMGRGDLGVSLLPGGGGHGPHHLAPDLGAEVRARTPGGHPLHLGTRLGHPFRLYPLGRTLGAFGSSGGVFGNPGHFTGYPPIPSMTRFLRVGRVLPKAGLRLVAIRMASTKASTGSSAAKAQEISISRSVRRQGLSFLSEVRRSLEQLEQKGSVTGLMKPRVPWAPGILKTRAGEVGSWGTGSRGPKTASIRARISFPGTKRRRYSSGSELSRCMYSM